MKHFESDDRINVPADVPEPFKDEYKKNYNAITRGTDRLLLFSADQKIEHLNDDFYGFGLAPEINDPEHIFKIGAHGNIGALATHLGLIEKYATQYSTINYIVKLNAKTNLIKPDQHDPLSKELWSVEDIVQFGKNTSCLIRGVGYTVYLGSEYETDMLTEAAKTVYTAHQYGLIAILWMYPRGKSVPHERAGNLIAGAAGAGAALGADFVKINQPDAHDDKTSEQWLSVATQAAGKTKVVCSGGPSVNPEQLLTLLYNQIHKSGTAGAAIGRNIFQKPLAEALACTHALAAIIYENKTIQEALQFLE